MSLLCWYPLNGNLKNKGLGNFDLSGNTSVFSSDGKIGLCSTFDGSLLLKIWLNVGIRDSLYEKSFSLCAWIKTSSNRCVVNITFGVSLYANLFNLMSRVGSTLPATTVYSNTSSTDNTWHHICGTYDYSTNKMCFYRDGILTGTATYTATDKYDWYWGNLGAIGFNVNYLSSDQGAYFTGSINDVRIYDHCLSSKEIKEISKGLVLYYPLNDSLVNYKNKDLTWNQVCSGVPIVSNSTNYWTVTKDNNIYTIDSINDGTSKYYSLKIGDTSVMNHKYYIGTHVISNTFDSITVINPNPNNDSASALFILPGQTGYLSTIQTKVWWHAPNGVDGANYWVIQALSNNQSGKLVFTSPIITDLTTMFGSGNEPSVEDFELILTNINDKSYNSGTTILLDNIVYDSSGYSNDGTITGTLTTSTDTPRYDKCITGFTTSNFLYGPDLSFIKLNLTISCWVKLTQMPSGQVYIIGQGRDSTASGFNIKFNGNSNVPHFLGATSSAFDLTAGNTIPLNTWTHLAVTYNGSKACIYVNGNKTETSLSGDLTYTHGPLFVIGKMAYSYTLSNYYFPFTGGYVSDARVYCTALSASDIQELYNTSAFITDNGTVESYLFEESPSLVNLLKTELEGITTKLWLGGLSNYTQEHCQCTLTDLGYRIYRDSNLIYSSAGTVMWGGFVLSNSGNKFNLLDGHTYLLEFDIKGLTTNLNDTIGWNHTVGWNYGNTGINPTPTNIVCNNPNLGNFKSGTWQHFSYKWTISDSVYKVATQTYAYHTKGQTYLSYNGFKYGFTYLDTGELGTDIYINNLRMYDITTETPIQLQIEKSGEMLTTTVVENNDNAFVDSYGEINSNQLIEI